ncbi:unnamed protein product [Calypogeia fissa]
MGRGRRKSESLPQGQDGGTAQVKVEGGIGAFGLQEAPAFYPTEEEFENPLRYIAQIRPQAEPYGICRIVPPSSWNPPFGLDTVKFRFPTKLQAIHHLQERPAACDADTFKLEYIRFLRKTGEPVERWPSLDGVEVDLCKLFNAVKRHGGHEKVTLENRWTEVLRMVMTGAKDAQASSSISATLRQLYEKHLATFEVYQAKVGAGKRFRRKNKAETKEEVKGEAKEEAKEEVKEEAKEEVKQEKHESTDKRLEKQSRPRRGGRKRQSGGGADLDISGNSEKGEPAENELLEVLRPASEVDTRSQPKRRGRRRQSGGEADLEDLNEPLLRPPGEVESRPQPNPAAQRKRRKTGDKVAVPGEGLGRTDQICEQCHSGAHEQLMLLCDRCDRGWHLYCLSPPLSTVPVGNWYCLECLASESESFGFGQGQEYSFDSFRRMADRFKRKWVGTGPSSYADLEKEFWRVVEGGTAPVEVLYGSDLDTGVYGSGFPRAADPVPAWTTADAWDAGARNPWNVNNFPKLEGSMLRLVHDNIPGVMVPWLYIGMLFSSFCWHYEDHCFYSVNYLHCGEPKSWYSVPGSAAEEFEKVMRSSFPDLFQAQPDLLFQLVTMLKPTVLRDNGVPVCMTVQEPRNFVITFPRSYHGGFNHGFNCAEAVNFAPSDWLPYGGFGVERYRLYHKAAVLSHDELLCVVAKNDTSCARSPWLQQELSRVITKERYQREFLWSLGMVKSSPITPRPSQDFIGAEEDAECIICRYYLHLSAVVCRCRPGKAVCLQHARQLCECSADQQSLVYRFTMAELEDLLGNEDQSYENCKLGDQAAGPGNNRRRLRRGQSGSSSLASPLTKKVKGRPYKHSELADSWLIQARGAGKSHLRSPVLEELLTQAEQFLWGGHDMDQVRELVQKLNAAQKWVQDVASCSAATQRHGNASSGKAVKVDFAVVQQLVEVDPVPWVEPHLQTLKALFEPAQRFEQQITESLSSSFPLEIRLLQTLLQEASHSPFEIPGLQRLKDMLNFTQVWADRVRKVLSCAKLRTRARKDEVNLEQLQSLHTEGSKIPVMVVEKELLDSIIKNVLEWQQRACQILASSSTEQELEEALKQSESMLVHVVEVDLLEDRFYLAKMWVQHVRDALVQVRQQTDNAVSIKMLGDLLQSGRGLQVHGLDQMGLLELELQKVSWVHNASQTLLEYPTINYLQDLIVQATRLQLDKDKLGVEISSTLKAASSWESKAQKLLQTRGALADFTELESAAEKIHAKLPFLNPVKEAISEANLWLDRAQAFCQPLSTDLEEDKAERLDLPTLQVLVDDCQKLLVVQDYGKLLCAALATAESWVSEANILRASVFVIRQSESEAGCPPDARLEVLGKTEVNMGFSFSDEDGESSSRLEADVLKLQSLVEAGLALRLKLPEIKELQGLLSSTKWCLRARQLMKSSPTVKEAESHLEEATSLPVMLPEHACLQRMLVEAKAWLQAAASFLPGFGVKGNSTEEQLEQLISDALLLPVSVLSETACLEDILTSHRGWKRKVQHALAGATCLTWSELLKLQEAGEANMVQTEEEDLLNREVVSVGSWILRCQEYILRQPAYNAATLEELLLKMRSSIEVALRYLRTDDTRSDLERLCVCQSPIDKEADDNLLQCDFCQDWYHPLCLGVTQAQTRGQKQYVCPYCSSISCGAFSINRDLCSKIHATQRLRPSLLKELLSSARVLRCRVKEKELLGAVVDLVQKWQRNFHAMIKPALVCEDKHDAVNYHSLIAVQKAVEAMEVQDDEECLLQRALAANSWRHRVVRLLDESPKPLLRTLTRTLKEGMAIPISEEDFVWKELKQIETCASFWATRAKQVIGDHGRMPLLDVKALIAEGQDLPVALSKELSALRERSVLYCVCRKPYDEDRAMIACDRCGEWYHFSCINLPEPDSSDEEADDVIQQECELSGDFVCPQCKELSSRRDHQETGAGLMKAEYRDQVSKQDDAIDKVVEGSPFSGLVRGKRSNRSSNKARGEVRHRWQSPLIAPGKLLWHTQKRRKQHEQTDGSVSASGRPCRRTAGRHSRFESFVLLMRSR